MTRVDRSVAATALAGVVFCGAAGGSAMAIAFGALTLVALRLDAQMAFVGRHRAALSAPLAFAAIACASAARAVTICGGAFLVGRVVGGFR
ncbi:MAG: hypothetical protein NW223_23915 [Hyphomicrobiaceae bacterium]|nr:hypothetical protein [Hyphomicrobiaceae bacterium]